MASRGTGYGGGKKGVLPFRALFGGGIFDDRARGTGPGAIGVARKLGLGQADAGIKRARFAGVENEKVHAGPVVEIG